jgi:hypothetical protein
MRPMIRATRPEYPKGAGPRQRCRRVPPKGTADPGSGRPPAGTSVAPTDGLLRRTGSSYLDLRTAILGNLLRPTRSD